MTDFHVKTVTLFVEYLYNGGEPLERKYRYEYPLTAEFFNPHERDPKDLLDLLILADKYQVLSIAAHDNNGI